MAHLNTPTPMHRWASLRSELIWVYDGPEQTLGADMEADHRQGYWLWLLRTGSVTLSLGEKTLLARKGQWILSPPAILRHRFSKDSQILSIHFRHEWPTGENLFANKAGLVWEAKQTPRLERSISSLQRLAQRHFPGARLDLFLKSASYPVFMRFQHRFTLFLSDFSEAMTRFDQQLSHAGDSDQRVTRAVQCLHDAPLSEALPWGRLTQETGLGRKQLDRYFCAEFGITTRNYWEHLREESAMRLLENSAFSVKEIGYQLGFKQASHFTSWFHKRKGWSPRTHRQSGALAIAHGLVSQRGNP